MSSPINEYMGRVGEKLLADFPEPSFDTEYRRGMYLLLLRDIARAMVDMANDD